MHTQHTVGYGHTMAIPSTTDGPSPWRDRIKKRVVQMWKRLCRRRRGLSLASIVLGTLGAVVALWPLATTVWDLLGFTPGQVWRLAVLGGSALLLAFGVGWMNCGRTSPVRLVWLILAAWTVAAGAVATMTVLVWLVLGTPQWQPSGELTPKNLDAIATRAFAIVAGLGGVALLVIAYRRQRAIENSDEREVSRLFTETFDGAGEKLGSEHAVVRLAGVHALARLADEAPEGRDDLVQMVIDVLCAYLRMPYTPAPGLLPKSANKARREEHHERELEFASIREVRHTIIRIIGNHLREPTRWRGKNYDFTGTVFDGGDLSRAVFFGGRVDFSDAKITGSKVSFYEAEFCSTVIFRRAEFAGGIVDFSRAKITGGMVDFDFAKFSGARVSFNMAEFTGGTVTLIRTEFASAVVTFQGSKFIGSGVYFGGTKFTGATVAFHEAYFSDGDVFFGGAEFTMGTVDFDMASGACPDSLVKDILDGAPRIVALPEEWRPTTNKTGLKDGLGEPTDAPAD